MSIAVTPTVDFDILTSIGIKATDVFTTLRTNGTVWRTVTPLGKYSHFVQNMRHFAVFLAFQTVTPQTVLDRQSVDWRTVTARRQYRRFVQNMRLFAVFLACRTVTPQTIRATDGRSTGAP